MKAGLYRIRCRVTGEHYVGSSVGMLARWRSHKAKLKAGKHVNHKLQAAWNKHGADAFEFEIALVIESKELERAQRALARALIKAEQKLMITEKPAFNLALRAGLETAKGRPSWWHEGGERAERARKKLRADILANPRGGRRKRK